MASQNLLNRATLNNWSYFQGRLKPHNKTAAQPVSLAFTLLFMLPPGWICPWKLWACFTAHRRHVNTWWYQNESRHHCSWPPSQGKDITKRITVKTVKYKRKETYWWRRLKECDKQNGTGRHSRDGESSCVGEICSPDDLCFLLPPGLDRVMCNMLPYSQLRANSGTVWRHLGRGVGGVPLALHTQQTHHLSSCIFRIRFK